MNSVDADFVSRVEALECAMHSSNPFPINPILAAREVIKTSSVCPRHGRSPLRQELTSAAFKLEAPVLRRNYGSLDLSKMMSTSSSSASSSPLPTPVDGTFPMRHTKPTEEDWDLVEQDVSPASSAPNSPVLECSTHHKVMTTSRDSQSFGVMFGPDLIPEFVPVNEVLDYLDFMDTLEDCDSLGQFAEAFEVAISEPCVQVQNAELLVEPEDFSSSDVIALDQILNSPKPVFSIASPRITEAAWGLETSSLDSAAFSGVASPVVDHGTFEGIQWIPAIASLALVASMVMGPVY